MNDIRKIWPKWEPIEVLGQGGFGTVYKAKKESIGNTTFSAIKVIKIPNNQEEVKQMTTEGMTQDALKMYYKKSVDALINEIRIMDDMKSASHIVGIEDFEIIELEEEFGWKVFIRMELLTNLSTHLTSQNAGIKEVVKMAIDILSALEFCHLQGIVHRDIKPANIFVSKFGEYKLGDFGISRKVIDENAVMSQKGTKSYMAPEMIRMNDYSRNVDMYALGLTIYELLNHGRMPFLPPYPEVFYPQDREEAMYKRLRGDEFPDIKEIGSLNAIIKKACHFNPTQRYQTASEMKNDLLAYSKQLTSSKVIENTVVNEEKTITHITALFDDSPKTMADDNKTMGVFDHSDFLFEFKKVKDVVYQVNTSNNFKAYLVFTNGYLDLSDNIILTSDDSGTLKVSELYKTYLNVKKDYAQAISLLKQMIEIDENAQLYLTLGNSYYLADDKENAIHCYLKAYELDHDDSSILKQMALISHTYGNYDDCLNYVSQAINNYHLNKCSTSLYLVHSLYFIQAMAYQSLSNHKQAVNSIANIYKFNFKTNIYGWDVLKSNATDFSKVYHSLTKRFIVDKLYTSNSFLMTKKLVLASAIHFQIGEDLFKNTMTQNLPELISSLKNKPKYIKEGFKKLDIDFDEAYFYVTTSLTNQRIYFGKYGMYFEKNKELFYKDYYHLPLMYVQASNLDIHMIDLKSRYQPTISSSITIKNGNVAHLLSNLAKLKSALILDQTTPLDLPLTHLNLRLVVLKMMNKNNIYTIQDLMALSDEELFEKCNRTLSIFAELKAILFQL